MTTQPQIKESFVAFIDILGFKELIAADNGSGSSLSLVQEAIELATSELRHRQNDNTGRYHFWFQEFRVKSFSDCFCFSVPLEFDNGEKDYTQNLVAFCLWVLAFYNTLLMKGYLCRGGISQGWHYIDDDLIFSRGLVDAYEIESKMAVYPIVMLHDKLLQEIRRKGIENEEWCSYLFAHDNSGRNFLNPFNYAVVDELYFGTGSPEALRHVREDEDMLMERQLETISLKIKQHSGNNFVDKYQWLKELMAFVRKDKYSDKFRRKLMPLPSN
jgi:hypothetical protein